MAAPDKGRSPRPCRAGRRFCSLPLAIFVLFSAHQARCDFLVFKNGKSCEGEVTRLADGRFLQLPSRKLYSPHRTARYSQAPSVAALIREWSRELTGRQGAGEVEPYLYLAKFCLCQGRHQDAHRFARIWARARGWRACRTRSFILVTDAKAKMVKRVAGRLEAIVDRLRTDFGVATKPGCLVRLYADLDEFDRYCQELKIFPTAGFYHPAFRVLALPDQTSAAKVATDVEVYRCVARHFLLEHLLGCHPKHYWIVEGLPAYYETARCKGKRIKEVGGVHLDYEQRTRMALKAGRAVPLDRFLRMDQASFCHGGLYHQYVAQAWSLVHFFRHTKEKVLRGTYIRYLEILRRTGDDAKAFRQSFGTFGVDRIERAWRKEFGR